MRCIRFSVAAFLSLSCTALAGVLVVDKAGGPGSNFSDIQQALGFAPDGTVLLVRSGTYGPIAIGGQAVSIVADEGAVVEIGGGTMTESSAYGIRPGETLLLRGLKFTSTGTFYGGISGYTIGPTTPLHLRDCGGIVALEDCTAAGQPAVSIDACAGVVMSRCTFTGTPAVAATGSSLTASASTIAGANGASASTFGFGYFLNSHPGGSGLAVADGGSFVLSGCTVRGGAGGNGYLAFVGTWLPASAGGHGIDVLRGEPAVTLAGTAPSGGTAGFAGPNPSPPPGEPIHFASAAHVERFAVDPIEVAAPRTVREHQVATVSMHGPGNAVVIAVVGLGASDEFLPAGSGPLLIERPLAFVPMGPPIAPGEWQIAAHVPELGPGVLARTIRVQAIGCPQAQDCTLGGEAAIVLLDASF